MGFVYGNGGTGITVGGRDLAEFSAKLQTGYTMGACQVTTDLFQGKNRSSVLLLGQRFGLLEIVLPLEFWGSSRQDTVAKWSQFCQVVSGKVELDLGDGFVYACCVTDLGSPSFITDGWLTVDVTLQGMRQKPAVTISGKTEIGAALYCESTFPRTDCTIRLPKALLGGANLVQVELGDNSWYLKMNFTGGQDLVLDGIQKIFTLGGENVTAQMQWEDFPYLVPGTNPVSIYINTIAVTQGVEITYRPTFL
jgi:hypothetical protein